MKVVLDTHVWVWWLLLAPELPETERSALNSIADDKGIFLPAICLWEAQMLCAKGRLQTPVPFSAWLRRAAAPDVLTILPLDAETIIAVDAIPDHFHGDPADRMIVATARVQGLPLATSDKAIRRSRLVSIWRP